MTTINTGDLVTASQINQWAPPGIVADYAGATAPTGWLLCDGASYLRSDYPSLFTAIGTTFGAADGTHFNVPDCRGRVPVGYAASGGHTDVSTLGANDGVAAANRRPKHRTSLTDTGHVHGQGSIETAAQGPGSIKPQGVGLESASANSSTNTASATTGITVGTGNANDPLDTPSYIVLNKIIRAKDV